MLYVMELSCQLLSQEAVLRVHIVDVGGALSSDKLVEDFECLSGSIVAPNEMQAQWSQEKSCQAKFNPDNNRFEQLIVQLFPHKVIVNWRPVTSIGGFLQCNKINDELFMAVFV